MGKSDDYTNVLLEDMNGKLDAIMEIVMPMKAEMIEIKKSVAGIPFIEEDLAVIKTALKDTNVEIAGHEERMMALEETRT